jgi:hypothetical protein
MSDTAKDQARAEVESICRMVAALECDFERLEELREERDDYAAAYTPDYEGRAQWAEEYPNEAEELAELEEAAGEWSDRDDVQEDIQEDPLSIEVRSGWADVGETLTPEEFRIVLCTGGPHVEILGELDEHGEPDRVRVLYRDWSESGELHDFDHEAVLTYCKEFTFTY